MEDGKALDPQQCADVATLYHLPSTIFHNKQEMEDGKWKMEDGKALDSQQCADVATLYHLPSTIFHNKRQ